MVELLRGSSTVTFANNKPKIDEKATYNLTYGLFVVTCSDGRDNGCICNTAIQVASDPMRLAVSIQKDNLTREIIEITEKFNVSVLTQEVPFDVIRHFGMQSGRDTDKFSGFSGVERSHNGLYYLKENTNAMFSCDVKEKVDLGSHVMFIGEVVESKTLEKSPSCTYSYYHKQIKPKI